MAALIRCIRSDWHKFKHTSMLWIHIGIPLTTAILFLSYYSFAGWKADAKMQVYFQSIAIAFPLIISLICSKAVEQEGQAGSFQIMLCSIKSRAVMFISKLFVLLLLGTFSITLTIGVFAVGFKTVPYILYLKAIAFLIAGNSFIYILHLFLSFQWGKGASIGLGIAEILISSLMLTGLGDGKWYFVPCSWGGRLCGYLVEIWSNPINAVIGNSEIEKGLVIAIGCTIVAFMVSLIWFTKWEGRKCYD